MMLVSFKGYLEIKDGKATRVGRVGKVTRALKEFRGGRVTREIRVGKAIRV